MQNDIISPLLIPSGLFYEPFSCRSHNGRLTNRPLLYLCLSRVESMSTSVHTWCPCTGAWAPAQKSVAFRHCVLQVPKGHLVPEYKVETLYHGENPGVSTTWKKVVFTATIIVRHRARVPSVNTAFLFMALLVTKPTYFDLYFQRCQ